MNINIFKRKKKEEDTTPNHHTYGMINNFIYALKTGWKYEKKILFVIATAAICFSIFQLIGVYFPKIVIDMIGKNVSTKELLVTTAIVGGLLVITDYIANCMYYKRDSLFPLFIIKIKNNLLEKVFRTDYAHLENPDFLNLMNRAERATYDWGGFSNYFVRLHNVLLHSSLVIVSAASILVLNPIIVIILAIISYFTYKFFDNTMKKDKILYRDAMESTYRKMEYMDRTSRDFSYAKDIRIFNMVGWFSEIFEGLFSIFSNKVRESHNRWILCETKMQIFEIVQLAILYTWLIHRMLTTGMTIGNFTLYVGMVTTFTNGFRNLFSELVWMNFANLQIDDYRSFLEWPEAEVKTALGEETRTDVDLSKYEFKFEHVYFKYPGHEDKDYILNDVNLTIKPGMKLAIVGINGAGKTTLIKLLMKLYNPMKGRILLNGVDIKEYNKESYYKIFSPVFQNIESFAMPVWQNISLKDEENTDRDKVNYSLERSGLNTKIDKFSKGIDTEMLKIFHKDGIDLSGGEKQRMALSRALYKNGNVVILDEPTAALDALAEDKMYQEINKLVENKTTVFISHRLSSTRFCDAIAMFENGKIIEYGTHDELIKLDGKYCNMFNVQAQYYKEHKGEENYETA